MTHRNAILLVRSFSSTTPLDHVLTKKPPLKHPASPRDTPNQSKLSTPSAHPTNAASSPSSTQNSKKSNHSTMNGKATPSDDLIS